MMRRPDSGDSMMRGGPDLMMGRDSMMRSMSVSNGSGGGGFGGLGPGSASSANLRNEDGAFNRSMSYHGSNGSGSPPSSFGGDGLKIGMWNEGRGGGEQGGMGRGGGGMGGQGGGPVSNFEIGTFNMSDPSRSGGSFGGGQMGGSGPTTQSNSGPIQPGMGIRETGIIEKLLHSYGFIQCCDRQARLFFHFSQFDGNIEHLKIGDPVEFEMTYDRRTGKPIASAVSKIAPEVRNTKYDQKCTNTQIQ
jgi:cold shock CspA family protein